VRDFTAIEIVVAFIFGMLVGIALASIEKDRDEAPGLTLSAQLKACGYTNHGISDVAWELYARGLIPLGSALYYTNMVRSSNTEAAKCMERLLTGQEA
jgi:hypothetical protein